MKKFLLLTVPLILGVMCAFLPPPFISQLIQITDNDFNDSCPAVSGDYLVWHCDKGNEQELYLYDFVKQTNISLTDQAIKCSRPAISFPYIAWTQQFPDGEEDIVLYNLHNGLQMRLINRQVADGTPVIKGEYLTWKGTANNETILYLKRLGKTSVKRFHLGSYPVKYSLGSRYLVWENGNKEIGGEIFAYDLQTGMVKRLTNNKSYDTSPVSEGNNIVWLVQDGSSNKITLYNGLSDARIDISVDDESASDIVVANNSVTWFSWYGKNANVMNYDVMTGQRHQITDDFIEKRALCVNNGKILWYAKVMGRNSLNIYDISSGSTRQLKFAEMSEEPYVVDGNRIIWSASDGKDAEIYIDELEI